MLLAAFALWAVLSSVNGASDEGTVAFMAAYDSDTQLKTGEVLVPKKVLINHGGGYNSYTGVFRAPKSGIYVFQFHTLTTKTSSSFLSLYHNGVYVISAFARQLQDYDAAGNSAILRLEERDRVYLKARTPASVYGRPDDIYTTFSGYSIGLSADSDSE